MEKRLLFIKIIGIIALFTTGCDYHTHNDEVYGCTDPIATNYDPDANVFNHSCTYSNDTGEIRTKQIAVLEKMYTAANPNYVTIYIEDNDVNSETILIFAATLNDDGLTNAENYESYFSEIIYIHPLSYYENNYENPIENGYDDKTGYAALITDSDQDLIGKELKIWYLIP